MCSKVTTVEHPLHGIRSLCHKLSPDPTVYWVGVDASLVGMSRWGGTKTGWSEADSSKTHHVFQHYVVAMFCSTYRSTVLILHVELLCSNHFVPLLIDFSTRSRTYEHSIHILLLVATRSHYYFCEQIRTDNKQQANNRNITTTAYEYD